VITKLVYLDVRCCNLNVQSTDLMLEDSSSWTEPRRQVSCDGNSDKSKISSGNSWL